MPNSTALLEFTVYCFGYIRLDPASGLTNNKINIRGLTVALPLKIRLLLFLQI
jgi:hypothetical protein